MRSFWIIWVGPQFNYKCPYKGQKRIRHGHREGHMKKEAEIGGVALAHFLLPLCVFFSFLQSAKPEIKCKRNSWADTPPFRAMPYHWFESLERIALSTPVIQSIFLGEQ